jgi:uncharacterized iron-regulated membrane protein
VWSDWINRPQSRPLRKALFQVHLWLALALGVYIVVICVTGSAVIFRGDINRAVVTQRVASTEGEPLAGDALAAAIEDVYSEYTVVRFSEPFRPGRPVSVLVERDGVEHGRLFDHYAGIDLGESYPWPVATIEWLVSLHDDLLGGFTGRKVNGVGAALTVLLVLTGFIIWWPGRARWKQSLYFRPTMPRALWHLHSAVGFWIFLLVLNWAVTGPIEGLVDWFDPDLTDFERPGERIVRFFVNLHFGRFGGYWGRTTWAVLGLLPPVLFISGFILWWRRVVRPRI